MINNELCDIKTMEKKHDWINVRGGGFLMRGFMHPFFY